MKPKQAPGLEIRAVGDEVLVHDAERGKVHVLNASAGKILELCDGTRTIEEVAVGLAGAYSTDAAQVRPDVDRALDDFRGLGILQPG